MQNDTAIVPIFTLVLSAFCLSIGAIGIAFPAKNSVPFSQKNPPLNVEIIRVNLSDAPQKIVVENDTAAPASQPDFSPENISQPPQIANPSRPPAIAPVEPKEIAFAIPAGKNLENVAQNDTDAAKIPEEKTAAKTLILGQGEGVQPRPPYPMRARQLNQTGTVRVRFSVAGNGAISHAEAVAPCPHALLNDAAVSTIRNRWRFAPSGAIRLYEVEIRFEISDR